MALHKNQFNDFEIIAAYYGVTPEEAKILIEAYGMDQLLGKQRSTSGRSVSGSVVGTTIEDLTAALDAVESSLAIGQSARLEMCTEQMPSDADLAQLYLDLVNAGFHVSYPVASMASGIPTTSIALRKGSPEWVALVPILPTLFVIGLIAFGITQISNISSAIFPIVLTLVLGVVALAVITTSRRPKLLGANAMQGFLPSTIPNFLPQVEYRVKLQELWKKACEWDKIPPDSKFVTFSVDNPYMKEYNEVMGKYLRFQEVARGKFSPDTATKLKYVRVKNTGAIIEKESWEREKQGYIMRGEVPPEVEYLPATEPDVGEPLPPEYRHLAGWFQEPVPEFWPAVEAVEGGSKVDTLLKQLQAGVDAIQKSDNFRQFLTAMAKFHDYSMGNIILIMFQKPNATHVAGFNTWKDLGRFVKKGEKGIAILAPVMPSRPKCPKCGGKVPGDAEYCPKCGQSVADLEQGKRPVYFKVVYVFDISQTEGKDLPDVAVPVLSGEANEVLFNNLMAMASREGLNVSFESRPDISPETKGSITGKLIWIRPEEARAQQLKTFLHEMCHYFTEHVFQIPRRDAETIAESASFAVAAHFGFDTGLRSFPYVALWSQDKKVLEANLSTIRKVTDRMIHELAGEERLPATTAETAIERGLKMSIVEEETAEAAYKGRGQVAGTQGDRQTADLYEHIAQEEHNHADEFSERLEDVSKLDYVPDSAEFLAQTIDDSGWREKIDRAFLEAIERVRK
ncbi:MAG: ArdC-like ssDNA-binding domain-containing protein [Dehalococcoidales bacterium]|nr:ArdC-like ssDNA-binding domain-containing protein [Dehalococcoidales bacterium]